LDRLNRADADALARDPLLATLLDKIRAAKCERRACTEGFERERASLERANTATRAFIETQRAGVLTGAASDLFAADRTEAVRSRCESDARAAKGERRACAVVGGMDAVELARSQIAALSAEAERLEAALAPLRKQRRKALVKERFLLSVQAAAARKESLGRQTRSALARARTGLPERQRLVEQLEEQRRRLEQGNERLARDR